jgi:hypothetical protein
MTGCTGSEAINLILRVTQGGINMSSNYPCGVSGNEYSISGPDWETESNIECPVCDGEMMEYGYRRETWVKCVVCGYTMDIDKE